MIAKLGLPTKAIPSSTEMARMTRALVHISKCVSFGTEIQRQHQKGQACFDLQVGWNPKRVLKRNLCQISRQFLKIYRLRTSSS